MKSIIQSDRICFLCGRRAGLELHHIFFGNPNRKLSDEDGMTVWLCSDCHRNSPRSAHMNRETDLMLKRLAQKEWERTYGDRNAFIGRYGKNYL